MLIFQQRVFPQDIQSNPCVYYIIADNDARAGHTVYRNCENVIGVRVKKDEYNKDGSFWSDLTFEDNMNKFKHDFRAVRTLVKHQVPVVFCEALFDVNFDEYAKISPKTSNQILEHLKFKLEM